MTTSKKQEKISLRKNDAAQKIYTVLLMHDPNPHCALTHNEAFELLVATILSAQCTDERVNKVTPGLFKAYPTPQTLAKVEQEDLEEIIRSTGFYRNKAKSIIGASKAIVERYNGKVPDTMEDLLTLPGVARKTANVVLGTAFGKNVGVVVDTHVGRLSRRMGFTGEKDPGKVEKDLMGLFPRKDWTTLGHLLIWHGRRTCNARKPDCKNCLVNRLCPKIGVEAAS